MADETKPTPAPAPAPAPRFPLLRKAAQFALVVAMTYIGARFGVPVDGPAPAVPVAPATGADWPTLDPTAGPVTVSVERVCDHPVQDGAPAITGATAYQPYQLVRLKASGVKPGAAVLWRVSPRTAVDRATTKGDVCEFSAPPGSYEVELLVIAKDGDALSTQEVFTRVVIGGKKDDTQPQPQEPKDGKADALKALAQIRFGNSSCTATVIGPRRADGRWDVLTASHCMPGVGSKGTMKLKDGRTVAVRVVVHEKGPDLAWMVTEDATLADLAFANLSATNPAPGVKVWHAGYGIDVPGNREDGEVLRPETTDGQTQFMLSVSPGDSGGGVFRSDTNELVSTVCCTQGLARKTNMWGASVASVRKARPGTVRLNELPEPSAHTDAPRCGLFALAF